MPERGLNATDPGGESINVTVTVNGQQKFTRTATITTPVGQAGSYRYTTDDGETVIHNRNSGIKNLAVVLLNA